MPLTEVIHGPVAEKAAVVANRAAQSLCEAQLATCDVNAEYGRLYAALGIPTQSPGFERRWDYSNFPLRTLLRGAQLAGPLIDSRERVDFSPATPLGGFFTRFAARMQEPINYTTDDTMTAGVSGTTKEY